MALLNWNIEDPILVWQWNIKTDGMQCTFSSYATQRWDRKRQMRATGGRYGKLPGKSDNNSQHMAHICIQRIVVYLSGDSIEIVYNANILLTWKWEHELLVSVGFELNVSRKEQQQHKFSAVNNFRQNPINENKSQPDQAEEICLVFVFFIYFWAFVVCSMCVCIVSQKHLSWFFSDGFVSTSASMFNRFG